MNNGTGWQPVSQLISANASLELISSSIKFRASLSDCNSALSTLEYRSIYSLSPTVNEIARITIVVNDMGNYGCFNDCSTATPVPLLAMSTIVIVNYGWFTHTWLLLRPGVLLGATTGIGMLLIVGASICAWLHFVRKMPTAQIEKNHSFLEAQEDPFLLEFSDAQYLAPNKGQQIVPLLNANGGDMPQYENPPASYNIRTEGLHPDDEVQSDTIHQNIAKEETSGGGIAENYSVQNNFGVINEKSGDLAASSDDGLHEISRIPLSDIVCSESFTNSGSANVNIQPKFALDPWGYVERTSLENETCLNTRNNMAAAPSGFFPSANASKSTSLVNDILQAIHSPRVGSWHTQSTKYTQQDGLASHSTLPMCSLQAESPFRWPGQRVAEGGILATNSIEALDSHDSYGGMPAFYPHSGNLFECNTASMTDQIDGLPYETPVEVDKEVAQERGRYSNYSLSLQAPPAEEHWQTGERFPPVNNDSIMMDTMILPANHRHNAGSDNHILGTCEHKESIALLPHATDFLPSEYRIQFKSESQDFDNSMPFGDSSSSSHSSAAIEDNTKRMDMHGEVEVGMLVPSPYPERVDPKPMLFGDSRSSSHSFAAIEDNTKNAALQQSMMDMHGEVEEVGMLVPSPYPERVDLKPNDESKTDIPLKHSHPDEISTEQASPIPKLKVVLELSEASNLDNGMDLLEQVDLVFSSFETCADGSMVAVLSQRNT